MDLWYVTFDIPSQGLGSLDDDDPNILLAIQLSLQDSGLAGSDSDALASEASLGAIGTSLPSRLDQGPSAVEILHRASLSSSELLELGDSLARLGAVNACSQYSATAASVTASAQHWTHKASAPIPVAPGGSTSSTGIFSCSSDTVDSADQSSANAAAAANANLLGNIMAWFHDMNPQGVTLVPSASSDTDSDLVGVGGGGDGGKTQQASSNEGQFHSLHGAPEEKERAAPDRPTQLDLAGLEAVARPYVAALEAGGDGSERAKAAKVCHVDTPRCDSVSDQLPSTSSSEWEDQVHLV